MSKLTAASPSALHARAKSKCDSLHEFAPWRMTTVASGPDAGRNNAKDSPSTIPISAGGSTLTVRMAWHDPPPMAALQQLSPVFPMGSRINAAGNLEIGGCDALELAHEFGTPAYIVAEDDLRARARAFTQAFAGHTDDFEVVFASKAFPCTAILRVFAEEGLGCDVASGGELHLALRAGFAAERIYLHGNAKSEAELRMAVEAGVGWIVLDNVDEIAKLGRVVAPGTRQRVLLRVTPGVEAETHAAILTGHAESKFGFEPAHAAEVARGRWDHLDVQGFHFHIGSQLFDLGPYREAVAALAPLPDMPVYSLGGGMAVPYTAEDRAPGPEASVAALVDTAREGLGEGKRLVLGPGRPPAANAGVPLYTVQSVKQRSGGPRIVAVDGGMSDNLRPMLYD